MPAPQDEAERPPSLSWGDLTAFSTTSRGTDLLLEMFLSLALAIYFLASPHGAYAVCPLIELVFAGIFFWVYLNHYDQTIVSLSFAWTDVFRCVGATVIFLVISISYGSARNVIGVMLSFLAMLVFCHNIYLLRSACRPPGPEPSESPSP